MIALAPSYTNRSAAHSALDLDALASPSTWWRRLGENARRIEPWHRSSRSQYRRARSRSGATARREGRRFPKQLAPASGSRISVLNLCAPRTPATFAERGRPAATSRTMRLASFPWRRKRATRRCRSHRARVAAAWRFVDSREPSAARSARHQLLALETTPGARPIIKIALRVIPISARRAADGDGAKSDAFVERPRRAESQNGDCHVVSARG